MLKYFPKISSQIAAWIASVNSPLYTCPCVHVHVHVHVHEDA